MATTFSVGHSRRLSRTRLAGVGLLALTLLTAPLTAGPADGSPARADRASTPRTAVADEVHAPVPELDWTRCGRALECATALVPLDYDQPDGPQTQLALTRRPADDQDARIGTLFVNPGGPGGPATQVVGPFARLLGPDVRDSFDVVGIDPRGVGGSSQVTCRSAGPMNYPRNTVPLTLRQARPLLRSNHRLRQACRRHASPILDHMTTADTARDMDLIRQAVGDDQLTYYGISYGTYLGETYAAMFPDRVRAIILDGVLDPVAWSTGRGQAHRTLPFSTRLRSGVGAWEALVSAFDECDRVSRMRCPLSGHSHQHWLRIIHRLRQGPFHVGRDEGGGVIRYADVVGGTLGALYSRGSIRFIMTAINQLYRDMFGHATTSSGPAAPVPALAKALRRSARSMPGPYGGSVVPSSARPDTLYPSFEGVACSDSLNPARPNAWLPAATIADRQGPWFGRVWTFASSPCAHWPGSGDDAFRGPWRVRTSSPVLIVGNFHDPATPISGARTVNSLFAGSRLLSLDTWNHGAIGQSACVTSRMSSYLVAGRLPVAGQVCSPDRELFPRRK